MILVNIRCQVPLGNLIFFQMQVGVNKIRTAFPPNFRLCFKASPKPEGGELFGRKQHMLRLQPKLKNHVCNQRFAGFSQVSQPGVKAEQAQIRLFVQFAAFIGVQQGAECILGCRADVRWKNILKTIQHFHIARGILRIGVVQPGCFDKTKTVACAPAISKRQPKRMVDLFKDQRGSRDILIKIAFNVVLSILPDRKWFPKPGLVSP